MAMAKEKGREERLSPVGPAPGGGGGGGGGGVRADCVTTLAACDVLQARKFLPYGYGPGKKTVIKDAASFDDDEEDYGDYQVSEERWGQGIDLMAVFCELL